MSEAGRLLASLATLVIAVLALLLWLRLAIKQECQTKLSGSALEILPKLRFCAEQCWNEHRGSPYNYDCYTLSLSLESELGKEQVEAPNKIPIRAYFEALPPGQHSLKLRYNQSEISLIPY